MRCACDAIAAGIGRYDTRGRSHIAIAIAGAPMREASGPARPGGGSRAAKGGGGRSAGLIPVAGRLQSRGFEQVPFEIRTQRYKVQAHLPHRRVIAVAPQESFAGYGQRRGIGGGKGKEGRQGDPNYLPDCRAPDVNATRSIFRSVVQKNSWREHTVQF